MEIYLIRHGMTAGNHSHRYIGRTDEPLTPEGILEARSAEKLPGCSHVYVTPLIRTQQTADILCPGAEQIIISDLREMDFGDFENRSPEEMEEDTSYRTWVDAGCAPPCPNGEGYEGFTRRVCASFAAVIRKEQEKNADRAVFILHGGCIMGIMEHFALPHRTFYEYWTKNCCGYRCTLQDGGPLTLKDTVSFPGEGALHSQTMPFP